MRINGEEVDRFNLEEIDAMEKTYYPAEGQYNIVEIKDGAIRVREDNSPDQIAVKTSWIYRNGQTSICLPHKLVIEIKQAGASDRKRTPAEQFLFSWLFYEDKQKKLSKTPIDQRVSQPETAFLIQEKRRIPTVRRKRNYG